MTALYTPLAGDIPSAAQYATWLPLAARRTVDSAAIISNTTLANDSQLFVPLDINVTYLVDMHLFYISAAAADMKIQFTAPAGAALVWGGTCYDTTGAVVSNGNWSLATVVAIGGTGVDIHGGFWGTLTTAGTAGNLQLQAAQNTSTASNTIIRAGSSLLLRQVP